MPRSKPKPRTRERRPLLAGEGKFDRQDWMGAVALMVATAAAFYPAWHGPFLWDDPEWTVHPRHLYRSVEGLWHLWTNPTALQQYYPLTGTTFWLDFHLWEDWALPYHLENILLHGTSAILFWRMLRHLRVDGAGLAAAIFALHPVMVESVGWITERKNVLCLALSLAAILCYGRSLQWWRLPEHGRHWRWYALALFFFGAALAAKVTAFAVPPVLLLLGWWKVGAIRWKRDAVPLLPFFATAIVAGLGITWLEKHHVGAIGAEWDLTFPERLLVAGRACWFYLGRFIWPLDACFVHPRWHLDSSSAAQWVPVVALVAALLFLILARRRLGRGVIVGVFCFLGPLIPLLGFMNVYGMRFTFVADRWAYFSALPLAALAAAAAARFHRRWSRPLLLQGVAGLVLWALAAQTWTHSGHLRSAETFWRSVLDRNPECWMAFNNLGIARAEAGNIHHAISLYRAALRLKPDYQEAHANLAGAYLKLGRTEEAIAELQSALQLNPRSAVLHYHLGVILSQTNRAEEAVEAFEKALESQPKSFAARQELGNLLLRLHRTDEAGVRYRELQQLRPYDPTVYINLGNFFIQTGHFAEGVAQLEEALRRSPSDQTALNNLSMVLSGCQNPAVRHVPRALELARTLNQLTHHSNPVFLATLAAACAEDGRLAEAAELTEKAAGIAERQGNSPLSETLRKQSATYRQRIPK